MRLSLNITAKLLLLWIISLCLLDLENQKRDNLEFKNIVLQSLWNASEIKEIKN